MKGKNEVHKWIKENKFTIFLLMCVYIVLSVSLFVFSIKDAKAIRQAHPKNILKQEQTESTPVLTKTSDDLISKKLKLNPDSRRFYIIGSWVLLSIGIGLIINLALLMLFFTGDRRKVYDEAKKQEEDVFKKTFPFDGIFLIKGVILFVFVQCVVKDMFLFFKDSGIDLNFLSVFVGTLGINVFLFLLLYGCVYDKKINFAALFGVRTQGFFKLCGYGVMGYFAFVPFMFLLAFVSYLVCNTFGVDIKPHSIVSYIADEKSTFVLTYWFLVAVLFAPFFEEVFFRGVIYRVFLKKHSVFVSMLVTSVIFSLLHFNYSQFLVIVFMGFVLNLMYHRTKSLIPCMVFHILNNTVSVSMLYFVLVGKQ